MPLRQQTTALALIMLTTIRVCGAEPPTALAVVRGPYIQNPAPSSVTVRWRTNLAVDSRLNWGPTPDQLTSVITDPTITTEHEVLLSGLAPATRSYYLIGCSAQDFAGGDAQHWFNTAPADESPDSAQIWILGDSGDPNGNALLVRDGYLVAVDGIASQLWLMLGDNAYPDGSDGQYQSAVFDTFPRFLSHLALWPALGNHDVVSSDPASQTGPFFDAFTLPTNGASGGPPSATEAYYSFDYGTIHFVCLDTTGPMTAGSTMLQWLEADLAATSAHWLIAFFHHPPYSKGSHDSDSEDRLIEVREVVAPVLETHGVDVVLSGHSHSYERSFLLDSHYGDSQGFDAATMVVDGGDGRVDGDGAYHKTQGPHGGTVYVVAGCSSSIHNTGSLDHPAMVVDHAELGSVVLDIEGDRLDARFVNTAGSSLDRFTIFKPTSLFIDGFESGDLGAWSSAAP